MTTTARRAHAPAWVLAFLAAVLAVVLGAFTAGPAPAATGSAAQNAVGASASAAQVAVEPSASITAGQRLGNDPPQAGLVVATGVAANTVPASTVRFSQGSVNGAAEIEASMRANGWVGDAIDVVRMPDGGLTSLDNTRLLAANRAGIDVQASIRGFDDALPSSLVGRFTTTKGGVPSTWGDAVMNRIGNQSAGYRTANPFGSWVTGWSGN